MNRKNFNAVILHKFITLLLVVCKSCQRGWIKNTYAFSLKMLGYLKAVCSVNNKIGRAGKINILLQHKHNIKIFLVFFN